MNAASYLSHQAPFTISSVACIEGCIHVPRSYCNRHGMQIRQKYSVFYRIFRPNSITNSTHPPIVVIHGGLGLPSDYLLPIVDNVPYRCVIMYDQLGCGRSESPMDLNAYSIDGAVEDLQLLLDKLKLERFHLYAHSAGTCIAYEYLKKVCGERQRQRACERELDRHGDCIDTHAHRSQHCLSAVFSSGSFHIRMAKELADNMEREVKRDVLSTCDELDASQVAERIRMSCMCRTPNLPFQLKAAYSKAGTVWKGLDVIQDYVAECPLEGEEFFPKIMLLRGEFDFISEELVFQGWRNIFCEQQVECVTMEGCSHMPMLEDPAFHGRVINSFYSQHDQDCKESESELGSLSESASESTGERR